nr:hypothetical protein [Tanacetum cinerariifolium]
MSSACDSVACEEVHPVLPNQNDTMNERPARKIGLYTRLFDYANFRLPFSTFLIDVLRHFRINISQLSVIGATKVSHFEILCRVYGIVPTVGSFRCFYVDDFACPASFPWHTAKHVTRDLDPAATDFNAQDYATLVAHPSPFQKFTKAFMCLVRLSCHYTLDEETYPCELEASVERLFDEGGSGTQTERGDSAKGGLDANIQPIVETANTVVEDAAPVQASRQGKRKYVVVDASGRLLAGVVLNAEVGVAAILTLPFVTTSVSTMPECEDGDHTDSMAEPNLCTIGAPQRFVISSDSSHLSGPTIAEAEDDSLVRSSALIMTTATTVTFTVDSALVAKEKPVKPSLFSADSSSAGGADPNTGVFSDLTGSAFFVTNESRIDDRREMVDEFAPPKFFTSVRGMEHDKLFTEFNVRDARQMSLSTEVRMRAEYNVKERRRLKFVVENHDELLKARDGEIENLKAQLLLKETEAAKGRNVILKKERNSLDVKVTDFEALVVGKERDLIDLNAQLTSVKSQNDNLADQIYSAGLQEKIRVYDNCMEQLEKFQDDRMKIVNDKLEKLDSDLVEMACHLEEKFYPHSLNTISGRRWLLTHGLKLFLVKSLNSSEYLTALGDAISRAIEKGMQSGLVAGVDHGREGRSLADVAAYNPDTEADFNSALQEFREVDFPLLAELKSHKDASTKDIMNVLRLEDALADAPGMNDLQPDIKQLKFPIHRFEDQVVLGETFLSFALSVSHSQPLSVTSLMGEASTSGVVLAASVTTTALSTTFASASSIPFISIDDYEIIGVDSQEGVGTDGRVVVDGNFAPFPNIDDVELNIP